MFAFSTVSNEKFYDKGDIIFSKDGDTVGRVLKCLKVTTPGDEVFYAYDIESTKDVYDKMRSRQQVAILKKWRKIKGCWIWKEDFYTRFIPIFKDLGL